MYTLKHHFFVLFITFLSSVICSSSVVASNIQEFSSDRKTLKGITTFKISKTGRSSISPSSQAELEKVSEQIKPIIKSKLRTAGIGVVDNGMHPHLSVCLDILELKDKGVYSFFLNLEVLQSVSLNRDSEISGAFSSTWNVGHLGSGPNLKSVKDTLNLLLDMFLEAYFSVNPKKKKKLNSI